MLRSRSAHSGDGRRHRRCRAGGALIAR